MSRAFGASTLEEEKQLIVENARELAPICNVDYLSSETLDRVADFIAQIEKASLEACGDRETMLAAVAVDGEVLRHCSWALRDDPEVVLAAVNNEWSFEMATLAVRKNKEVVMKVVQRCGIALQYASDELRRDREVVLQALENDAEALQVAHISLRACKDIALTAVQLQAEALAYVSKELQEDREVVLKALQTQVGEPATQVNVLRHASPELRGDPQIVLEAAKYSASGLEFASEELREDKDFVLMALRLAQRGVRNGYLQAGESVRLSNSWESFQTVLHSAIACKGETAPVAAISHSAEVTSGSSGAAFLVEATLPSGCHFTCCLTSHHQESPPVSNLHPTAADPEPVSVAERQHHPEHEAPAFSGSSPNNAEVRLGLEVGVSDMSDLGKVSASRADGQQVAKPKERECPFIVNDVAKAVLAELPKHTKAPPQKRVFLTFADANSGDSEILLVTPWDWNRPLTDFLQNLT